MKSKTQKLSENSQNENQNNTNENIKIDKSFTQKKVKKDKNILTDDDINKYEITILENKIENKKSQASEVLPEWISNCVNIENSLSNSKPLSDEVYISNELKISLEKIKIEKLFPVQYTVIPAILNSWKTINIFRPIDICVCAPTGSGKTLAYVIPILQLLVESSGQSDGPRAIVILPIRDLAKQVHQVFQSVSKQLGIRSALITGHKNLIQERKDLFDQKPHVIVCTPGRLVEHIKNSERLNLSFLQLLVIDEADRVLADPKHDWFITLTKHINMGKRFKDIQSSFTQHGFPVIQKVLLSATLTSQPHLLEHFDLHLPKLFVIGNKIAQKSAIGGDLGENFAAPEGLKEYFVVYSKEYCRIIFIVDQICRQKMSHILCFTNTKESATRLNQLLNQFDNIRSAHVHCDQPPQVREKLRRSLETGKIDILVTVDSMGRGMDLSGVRCVIQYDVSSDPATYVHRVGRTSRAGQTGIAYCLVLPGQVYHLKSNLMKCGRDIKNCKFSQGKTYRYMNQYNAALAKLQGGTVAVVADHLDV